MTNYEYNKAMEAERDFEDDHHHVLAELEQRMYEERTPEERIIAELTGYMEVVKDFDKDSAQDASALHAYMLHLTQIMSRSNYLMADYQKKFRQQKKAAYLKLTASSHSQQQYFAPSLAKDYIDSQCSETGYVFDMATRVSATCVHTIDAIRSILSSLKSERAFSQYAT